MVLHLVYPNPVAVFLIYMIDWTYLFCSRLMWSMVTWLIGKKRLPMCQERPWQSVRTHNINAIYLCSGKKVQSIYGQPENVLPLGTVRQCPLRGYRLRSNSVCTKNYAHPKTLIRMLKPQLRRYSSIPFSGESAPIPPSRRSSFVRHTLASVAGTPLPLPRQSTTKYVCWIKYMKLNRWHIRQIYSKGRHSRRLTATW